MEESPAPSEGAATINQSESGRITAVLVKNDIEKALSAHPLPVTHSEHLSSSLVVIWSLFINTNDADYLQALIDEMDRAHPGLKYSPSTSTTGVDAFMDFEEDVSEENAQRLVKEIKVSVPDTMPLDANFIQRTHQALVSDSNLQLQLSPRALVFFLCTCRDFINADGDASLDKAIRFALQASNNHEKCTEAIPRMAWKPCDDPDSLSNAANVHRILSALLHMIQALESYTTDSATAIVQQHGALLKHSSIEDVMMKLSNAVDIATVKILMEQLAYIQAAMFAARNREVAKLLGATEKFLKIVLMGAEKEMQTED